MLWTIAVILMVLWLLGVMTRYTMGGVIHLVLAVALILGLISLYRSGRTLGGHKPS